VLLLLLLTASAAGGCCGGESEAGDNAGTQRHYWGKLISINSVRDGG